MDFNIQERLIKVENKNIYLPPMILSFLKAFYEETLDRKGLTITEMMHDSFLTKIYDVYKNTRNITPSYEQWLKGLSPANIRVYISKLNRILEESNVNIKIKSKRIYGATRYVFFQ